MNNRFLICKIQSITIDTKDKTKNVIIFDICMKPMFSECQTKYKEMIDIVLNIMSMFLVPRYLFRFIIENDFDI